jgi:hypothetical protein
MKKTLNAQLVITIQNKMGAELEKLGWIRLKEKGTAPHISCLFNKTIGNQIIHVLDIQRDRYWTNNNGLFTLNVGIFHKEYNSKFGFKPSGYIDTAYCILRTRIGHLKTGKDEWYNINPKTSIEPLSNQIWNDFELYGLPWFNSILDEGMLVEAMERDMPDSSIWLLALLNRKDEAKTHFKNIAYKRILRESPIIERAVEFGLLEESKVDEFKKAIIQSNEKMMKRLDKIFKQ